MKRLTALLFAAAFWHVGVAWVASGLDLVPFLAVVAASAAVMVWVQRRLVTAAELETEVWSIFGISVTRDVILSLVAAIVSSFGFYWIVWPRYGWDGYLAAVAISYGVPYAMGVWSS
jgi:hypothetical protein